MDNAIVSPEHSKRPFESKKIKGEISKYGRREIAIAPSTDP